jgi:hypothetical protein
VSERSAERGPGPGISQAVGFGVSIALHAALYALAVATTTLPVVDFEIELPTTAELGLSEASKAVLPAPSAPELPPEPPAPGPAAVSAEPDATKPPKHKPTDAGTPDAAAPDAAAPDAAAPVAAAPDAAAPDAAAPATAAPDAAAPVAVRASVDAGTPELAAYAPAGTQLSLRLHMAALRDSVLAPDVQRLLAAIPDWQALLGGSGVEPLHDLERLFLASPNLSRSSVVLAGEHRADPELPRRAVAQLAEAQGVEVRWKKQLGFPVARWANQDPTERIVALLGDNLFAITRPDDLERVLAVAQGLAERSAREQGRDASVPTGEALLALPEGEVLHFGVEGARQFVRGQVRGIPERLEGGATLTASGPVRITTRGQFEGPAQAEQARAYWQEIIDNLARQPLVALLGLGSALRSARLRVEDSVVRFEASLNLQQTRLVIGYLEGAVRPKPPRTPTAPAAASPPPPTPPPSSPITAPHPSLPPPSP